MSKAERANAGITEGEVARREAKKDGVSAVVRPEIEQSIDGGHVVGLTRLRSMTSNFEYATVLSDLDDVGVRTIMLNRPDRLNAMNRQLIDDVAEAFRDAHGDAATKSHHLHRRRPSVLCRRRPPTNTSSRLTKTRPAIWLMPFNEPPNRSSSVQSWWSERSTVGQSAAASSGPSTATSRSGPRPPEASSRRYRSTSSSRAP